jgi:predicted amidohydrolase
LGVITFRLGAAQMFIANELETNTETVLMMAEEASRKGIELLVFPEMCLNGYNPDTLTQDNFNDKLNMALDKISRKSAELNLGLIVGRAVFADEKLYNAATVILPDGTTHTFYKNNLTAAEEKYFTPGTKPLTFAYQGYKLGVIICRDQNYPELARETCKDVDALFILCAHYYKPLEARWKVDKNRALPIARAVENHCYVFMANTIGSHIGMISLGNSLIADPEGVLVVLADESSETIITCDIE